MKTSQIVKMTVYERLVYWITERERVRSKREILSPTPWTEDSILSSYRFCNVRRMDDKVSKWLMKNWYEPYFNHPMMLSAVALARFINKPESLILITEEVFDTKVRWEKIKKILRSHRDAGNVIFNGAYMVRGNDGQDKIECVVDHYVKPMVCTIHRNSMQDTWGEIHSCYGFGSFMAGQVVADLRWALQGSWEDKLTWAPIGPGSQRGMNRLYERPTGQSIKQEQFLKELKSMRNDLELQLPTQIFSRLELHDFQNCLCEFDKYERCLWNEGKPKQLYKAGK